ncbi:MAG TPA: hypothetical protein VKB47_08645 [Terracidiphilus sp.]|nr:hypothetical protein [Terracidiphilus sp.]
MIVIRVDDASLALDPAIAPRDAEDLVAHYMPQLAANVQQARAEKKKGARLELGPRPE